eukprot:4704224-Amphidinium_carterae.1
MRTQPQIQAEVSAVSIQGLNTTPLMQPRCSAMAVKVRGSCHWLDHFQDAVMGHLHLPCYHAHVRLAIFPLIFPYEATVLGGCENRVVCLVNGLEHVLVLPPWTCFAKALVEIDGHGVNWFFGCFEACVRCVVIDLLVQQFRNIMTSTLAEDHQTPSLSKLACIHLVHAFMSVHTHLSLDAGPTLPFRSTYGGWKTVREYLLDVQLVGCGPVVVVDESGSGSQQDAAFGPMALLVPASNLAQFRSMMVAHFPGVTIPAISGSSPSCSCEPAKVVISDTVPYVECSVNIPAAQLLEGAGRTPTLKRPAAAMFDEERADADEESSQDTSNSPGLEGFRYLIEDGYFALPERRRIQVHVTPYPTVRSATCVRSEDSYNGYIVKLDRRNTASKLTFLLKQHLRCRQDQVELWLDGQKLDPAQRLRGRIPLLSFRVVRDVDRSRRTPISNPRLPLMVLRSGPDADCVSTQLQQQVDLLPTLVDDSAACNPSDKRIFVTVTRCNGELLGFRVLCTVNTTVDMVMKLAEKALNVKCGPPLLHQEDDACGSSRRECQRPTYLNPQLIAHQFAIIDLVEQGSDMHNDEGSMPVHDDQLLVFDEVTIPCHVVVDIGSISGEQCANEQSTLYILRPDGRKFETYSVFRVTLQGDVTCEQVARRLARWWKIAKSRIGFELKDFQFHDDCVHVPARQRLFTSTMAGLGELDKVNGLTHVYVKVRPSGAVKQVAETDKDGTGEQSNEEDGTDTGSDAEQRGRLAQEVVPTPMDQLRDCVKTIARNLHALPVLVESVLRTGGGKTDQQNTIRQIALQRATGVVGEIVSVPQLQTIVKHMGTAMAITRCNSQAQAMRCISAALKRALFTKEAAEVLAKLASLSDKGAAKLSEVACNMLKSCDESISSEDVEICKQPGDGDCLFHSLAFTLNDGTDAGTLQAEVKLFIESNPNLLVAGTPISEWVNMETRDMASMPDSSQRARWGGGVELAAFSQLKSISVAVYVAQRIENGTIYSRTSFFE